jgi:hypothetical protein
VHPVSSYCTGLLRWTVKRPLKILFDSDDMTSLVNRILRFRVNSDKFRFYTKPTTILNYYKDILRKQCITSLDYGVVIISRTFNSLVFFSNDFV